ncbi:MAG: hypothetical protein V4629_12135 [Pseudomonadota bacterium]
MLATAINNKKRKIGHIQSQKIIKWLGISAILFLSGCAKFQLGQEVHSRNPIEKPAYNFTTFSDSLECVDHLLYMMDAEPIMLTAQEVSNYTMEAQPLAGMKDMMISAFSRMSQRSGKIQFVAYGTDIRDIILLHKAHRQANEFAVPDYFIRGGITQLDRNVVINRIGGAVSADEVNAAYSGGQSISYIGLDLNMGTVKNLQMLSNVTSNNVLAMYDRGFGNELGGSIKSVGLAFDFGIDRKDGLGQAIRNLVDLGAIEIVGKLTDVPYMSCLPVNYSDPDIQTLIDKEYYNLRSKSGKLIKVIQMRLAEIGYYHGKIDGLPNKETLLAINYFKTLYQMPANEPLITINLYKHLLYGEKFEWPRAQMRVNGEFAPAVSKTNRQVIQQVREGHELNRFDLIEDDL